VKCRPPVTSLLEGLTREYVLLLLSGGLGHGRGLLNINVFCFELRVWLAALDFVACWVWLALSGVMGRCRVRHEVGCLGSAVYGWGFVKISDRKCAERTPGLAGPMCTTVSHASAQPNSHYSVRSPH
jgi:hypothetical protein